MRIKTNDELAKDKSILVRYARIVWWVFGKIQWDSRVLWESSAINEREQSKT